MANPDPVTPGESEPESTSEQQFHTSDYLKDDQATDKAFNEIVSELLDLSTDQHDQETSLTADPKEKQVFPVAPWVTDGSWGHSEGNDPRGWKIDQETIDEIDAFQQPDPPLELSKDPARNLGWFLTISSLLTALISYIFVRGSQPMLFAILGIMFMIGLALLIWRMPENHESDLDGGARL